LSNTTKLMPAASAKPTITTSTNSAHSGIQGAAEPARAKPRLPMKAANQSRVLPRFGVGSAMSCTFRALA
jgi:hypothetical protein